MFLALLLKISKRKIHYTKKYNTSKDSFEGFHEDKEQKIKIYILL
jgi:hypothetical protein